MDQETLFERIGCADELTHKILSNQEHLHMGAQSHQEHLHMGHNDLLLHPKDDLKNAYHEHFRMRSVHPFRVLEF